MRRLVSVLALLGAVTAQVVLIAAPANAYYVDVSVTGAGSVTEETDADVLPDGCTSSGTTPTGTLGASCRAGTADGPYSWGWVVRYRATAAPGYQFKHWASDGRTSPRAVACDGATGATHTGSTCQFATYENQQVRAVFEDVTTPGTPTVSGPTQPVNGSTSFSFSLLDDPTFSHFECQVPGIHGWQTCTSGTQETPVASGSYTFEVRAVDHSGLKSGVASWPWTVDKNPPDSSINSGPSGSVSSTSAMFSFSSNEQSTFSCTIDNVLYTSCTSPRVINGLTNGTHTFSVTARDLAGNIDPSPATRTWTVDTIAPDTTITSGPAPLTRSTSADFELTATEQGGDFLCTLDGESEPCAGPHEVAEGNHTFTVAARDAVGNTDSTPASWTWRVDTTAPVVASRAPTGRRVGTGSNVVVTFSEAMQEASVEALRDGKPLAVTLSLGLTKVPATVTYTETTDGAFRAVLDPARRLRAGKEYRARVTSRALDLAGNPALPFSWTFRTKG
jgi:hypothetical protein